MDKEEAIKEIKSVLKKVNPDREPFFYAPSDIPTFARMGCYSGFLLTWEYDRGFFAHSDEGTVSGSVSKTAWQALRTYIEAQTKAYQEEIDKLTELNTRLWLGGPERKEE